MTEGGVSLRPCPTCKAQTKPHCNNPHCTWDWCPACNRFGIPGQSWLAKIQEGR